MKEIKITALTEPAVKAIRQNMEESKKLRMAHRMQFKMMGYRQDIVCEDPVVLSITLTNSRFRQLVQAEDIVRKAKEMMLKNGASEEDYTIEVIE